MNKDQLTGTFDQLKGKIKEEWGELTNDEIALYNGQRDQFFGKLKARYGLAREEAQEQMRLIEKACGYNRADAA